MVRRTALVRSSLFALAYLVFVCAGAAVHASANARGQITFNGLPVPGASITATQIAKVIVVTSDEDGAYTLAGLDDGHLHDSGRDAGVVPVTRRLTAGDAAELAMIELQILPFDEIRKVATL